MRTGLLLVAAGILLLGGPLAWAEVPATLKIGVINDMNGPFADQSGKGSVVAAQMAAEDFAAEGNAPFKVEILSADHQNKADLGRRSRANGWTARGSPRSPIR
jgi:branched-chain amino acid transport system substrate-binding protein